jgi:hypothetical protein
MPPARQGRCGVARLAVGVGRHVGQHRLGHLDGIGLQAVALRVHLDVDGNGRIANLDNISIERQQVADEHRILEQERVHGDGRHAAVGAAGGRQRAGDIDLRHDPAAEDIAVDIGVGRRWHHAQLRHFAGRQAAVDRGDGDGCWIFGRGHREFSSGATITGIEP